MLEIKKTVEKWDMNYYRFEIKKDNMIFNIYFNGNLDLYWNIQDCYKDRADFDARYEETKKETMKTFTITKENYFLYSLFEELFIDIETLDSYNSTLDMELRNCETKDEIKESFSRQKEHIESLKTSDAYKRLYHNGIIEWLSDDDPDDIASLVTIKKENEEFILNFKKSREDRWTSRPTFAIRFRNARSQYFPFNGLFMKMFNKLKDYEPEFHQVHIEEYLYQKKLKR